ncbi:MAG: putative Ig domain-containing protein [Thermoplasmata archaeon]|nr:MAG: putative Ig domain-containing protein [Thermoplasmata archaeon]
MRKRHAVHVLVWILILPVLVIIIPLEDNLPIEMASAAQPPAIEDATIFWDGDWDVDSNAIYRNQTIIVNGNITVLGGFSLTLVNVTIRMNNTGNLTTYIHVNNGAILLISDYDNNPITTYDGCNITSNNTDGDHRFGFYVHQSSSFTMINSAVSEVGYSQGSIEERGLYIHTDNAVIRNCSISRGYRGINVDASLGTIIENCTLTDLDDDGIFIQSTSDSLFYNNIIDLNSSGDYGISFTSGCWRNKVAGNTINVISGNSEGIRIAGGGEWNELHQNTINVTGLGSEGIRLYSGYVNITSNTICGWDQASEGIQLSGGSYINVIDNEVIASGINICALGIFGVDNVTVKNNNFTVSQDNCRAIAIGFSAHDILIENTTITVTSGINNYGINCDNTYDVMIVNTTIFGPQTGIDVDSDSHVTALNTQFITYDVDDALSDFTVQHFLELTVEDWQGALLPGAFIQIKNSTGDTIFNGPADANGQIRYLPLTEVVHYESSSQAETPHNITVTYSGYDPWNTEVTMNQNRNIKATLQPMGVSKAQRKGDWWIDTTEEYWDTTFLMDGNITINATGNLILHNCTIMLNATQMNSQYHLNVTWGGELHLYDNDWDNYTVDDASVITDSPYDTDDGSPNDYVFSFYAWDGSVIEIRNSYIIDCGWDAPAFHDKGIYVETDSAVFNHAYIQGSFIGIIFADSVDSIVKNSTFNINGYSDFSCAIRAWNCPNLQVLYNNVDISTTHNDDIGIYAGYSPGSIIEGNQVNMYGTQGWNIGIFLAESSDYTVNNNSVSLNAPGAGLDFLEMDRCQVWGNTIFSYVDYCTAIDLYNLTNSLVNGNNVDLNSAGTGLQLVGFFDYTIIENLTITGNADFIDGIFLGDAHYVRLSNISIDLNGLGSFGFSTLSSDNISITNFTMNVIGAWGAGVVLNRTVDCLFESLSISTNGIIPAVMGISCSNVWIVNSTLNAQTTSDIDISQNSLLYLINTSFTDVNIIDPSTVLVVMWYLNVQVRDGLDQPYPGVNISVLWPDANEVINGTTDANGWLRWEVCLGYSQNETLFYNSTNPHNVRVFNTTCWEEIQVDLTYGSQTVVITLENDDPVITDPISNIQIDEDSFYYNTFHATDKEGNPLTWSINTSQTWITLNPSTGNLTVTPSNDNVGVYSFLIKVTDVNGGHDEFSFLLEVLNRAPEILTSNVGLALEDSQYYRDYDSDDDPNTIWTLENGPSWLNIDSVTGELFGTPNNSHVGVDPVNISVRDNHGGISYSEFNLWVINTKPIINTTDVFTASEDVYYQVDYNCSDDGQGDITWGLVTNATWLSIDSQTGVLSGTPNYLEIEDWIVNIFVYDGHSGWDFSNFTLTVKNSDPVISQNEITLINEDTSYYVDFASSDDGDGNIIWSLASNAEWLSINSTTGGLFGIPRNEHIGYYWINVTAEDEFGGLGWRNFTLNVFNTNDDPMITTTDVLSAFEDQLYSIIYQADDDDGDSLIWSLDTTANWLSIDPITGELYGTPTYHEAGSWQVTVSCVDGNNGTDSHTFTIIVENVNDKPVITFYLPLMMYPTVEEGIALDFNISHFDEDGDSLSVDWILDGQIKREDIPFWSYQPAFGTAGDHEVIVNVSDGNGASVEHRWIVIVTQANRAPIIDEYEPMNLKPRLNSNEESMMFTITASDPDNDALTYEWFIDGNDTGVRGSSFTFDRSSYGHGTYNLTVKVTDENDSFMMQSWEVEVKPPKKEEEEESLNIFLILAVVIAVICSLVLFMILKRKKATIEDIFIISNSGLPLAHRSKELRPDVDDDILSSMLTAVQEFIRDSFREKSKYGLRRLDFGDSVIHIKKGEHIYIAVVLVGDEPQDLEETLENMVSRIESKYGEILEDWDGDMEQLRGIKDIMDELMR